MQYDTDDTGTILHFSYEAMNSFWMPFNKRPHDEVLTIDAIPVPWDRALPARVPNRAHQPRGQRHVLQPARPAGGIETQQQVNFYKLDFSGAELPAAPGARCR